jgi:hypothetical protein
MAAAVRHALLAALLVGAALPAVAAGLTDPTLPPEPPAAKSPQAEGSAAAATPSRLQMVIRGPGESRVAVIDGVVARVGDRIAVDGGDARVARITDHSVTLTHGDTRKTLELLPSVSAPAARTDSLTKHAAAR